MDSPPSTKGSHLLPIDHEAHPTYYPTFGLPKAGWTLTFPRMLRWPSPSAGCAYTVSPFSQTRVPIAKCRGWRPTLSRRRLANLPRGLFFRPHQEEKVAAQDAL